MQLSQQIARLEKSYLFHHLSTSVRLIHAEYLYTRLPNLPENYRIGADVVLRLR
jgi:hypothetical protein